MIATNLHTISPIARDVYEGLTSVPRRLPAKLFYDAAGSALFEEITRLPEYYLTRTEAAILQTNAAEICSLAGKQSAGKNVTVIELAAGSGEKTKLLLAPLLRQQLGVTYAPVDVSQAALVAARQTVTRSLPGVHVQPVMSDLEDLAFLDSYHSPRLILFIGSTIGNLEDDEAIALLRRIAVRLQPDDRLLLGTDLAKDTAVLLPAYDDAQGVTARFNRNLLTRINRELGGDFDPEAFAHIARWNAERSRIEMHLGSQARQTVYIRDLGLTLEFANGDRIHTENSYKYTLPRVLALLAQAGFELQRTWFDRDAFDKAASDKEASDKEASGEQAWYAVHLAHIR
ncbi:MAG: L-histidine N(alpha)-methyltransferase [Acidobacteriota bacterium]|nr:L-histidine N(alpha)-methyltransferase [Acidobacteriota bacterium]